MAGTRSWRTLAGAAIWPAGVAQFLAIQLIAGAAWPSGYSWSRNNVSDLGNIHCGLWDSDHPRQVCSPLHAAVNASFVVQGLALAAGAILLAALWRRPTSGWRASAWFARGMMVLAGLGWILAGAFPADLDLNQHLLGALLIFFVGNLSLLVMLRGAGDAVPRTLRWLGGLAGLIGLAAAVSFLSGRYLGLGMGGLERVAIFPLQAWTAAAGLWLLAERRPLAIM